MTPLILYIYILMSVLLALAYTRRHPGFVTVLLLSLFLTPLLAALLLTAIGDPVRRVARKAVSQEKGDPA